MQQFSSFLGGLNPAKKAIILVATLLVFAAVLFSSQLLGAKKQALLYSNLQADAAGEVIAKLEQANVPYDVRGTAIFVDSDVRDSLRMTLATEGIPSVAGAGYELLDNLSGFGTTSQMFDAAYWRAKEGELARTIVTDTRIKSARVHISNSTSQPFGQTFKKTASVTISTGVSPLSSVKISGLKYLIASAVSGLDVSNVAVIDTQRGLISSTDNFPSNPNSNSGLTAALRKSVERILNARVGEGNAVVELSVEIVTESESVSERVFDPNTRVIISTDNEERTTKSNDTRGVGGVSVASNLPSGDASTDSKSSSQNTETRERVNYEVSETKREIVRMPGAIKRLTVAVLVNGTKATQNDGSETYEPRSDAEIAELRDLVAAAVGFREDRGDVITVKTLEFEPRPELGTSAVSTDANANPLDLMSLIQLAVFAAVVVILGLFVVRPVLANKSSETMVGLPAPNIDAGNTVTAANQLPNLQPDMGLPSLEGGVQIIDDNMSGLSLPELDASFPELNIADDMGGFGPDIASPIDRLKKLIEDRHDESLEVLQSWIEKKEDIV